VRTAESVKVSMSSALMGRALTVVGAAKTGGLGLGAGGGILTACGADIAVDAAAKGGATDALADAGGLAAVTLGLGFASGVTGLGDDEDDDAAFVGT
jgi:hypothetical protein